MNRKIIDFHAHAFHDKIAEKAAQNLTDYYGIPLAGNGKFSVVLGSMKEQGITKMVIHATATKEAQVETINDYVAGLINEDIIGFGTMHRDYENFEAELDRLVSLGLRGIKLHPIFQNFATDDPKMIPVYHAMAERKLPVLIHTGDKNRDLSSPHRLANVLEKVPNLTVIAPHMGGYSEWEEARKCLYGRENVYIDTSSGIRFLEPELSAELIREHGVERTLFGTDYPLALHVDELERFFRIPLSEAEREAILWDNACKLLNLR